MKKLVKNKIIFILTSILICFNSCKEKNTNQIERKIAKKVSEYLIDNDFLNDNQYSSDVYLHILSNKLNDNTFKTSVSLNGLISKSPDFNTEEFNVKGFKIIIYQNKAEDKYSLADVFFVPDAKSWKFLSEYYGNRILLNKLTPVYSIEDYESESLDELEF